MHTEEQLTCKKKKDKKHQEYKSLEDCLASSTEAEYIA